MKSETSFSVRQIFGGAYVCRKIMLKGIQELVFEDNSKLFVCLRVGRCYLLVMHNKLGRYSVCYVVCTVW